MQSITSFASVSEIMQRFDVEFPFLAAGLARWGGSPTVMEGFARPRFNFGTTRFLASKCAGGRPSIFSLIVSLRVTITEPSAVAPDARFYSGRS
jgi:hypothetical protein